MTRLVLNRPGIARLERDRQVAAQLRPKAEQILGRARSGAPSWEAAASWTWWTRHGVGPQGAFSQAVATGSGTVAAEYGGIRSRPYAFMRRAI